jgi:ribosomal protein S20
MTTAPVSSSTSTPADNPYANIRNDFRQLTQAIQSGDLSGAQSAFQAIQQSGVTPPANSPFANDLAAIGQALQSGDISSAQKALASLQLDAQQAQQAHHHGHHHHRHHGAASSDPTATSGSVDQASGVGTTIRTLA